MEKYKAKTTTNTFLSVSERVCPTCGTSAYKEYCGSNVDASKLDSFAFSSRKMPEYMHHRMVECHGCSLLYANPAPVAADLSTLYHQADYDSGEEANFASQTYATNLGEITSQLHHRGTAVDVGTGNGSFLNFLRAAGFSQVVGIEPSIRPIESADPSVKDLIINDIFRVESFRPASLSLVTCFQTLEHLADPRKFCQEVASLLQPGGGFYAVIHDRRAWSARILGTKSPIFDLEHLQLFCETSIRKMLDLAGFERISVQNLWNDYPVGYWAKLFPMPKTLKSPFVNLLRQSSIKNVRLKFPAGNLAVVAYKRA